MNISKTTLIYEHTFAAAHRLPNHPGKCRNIHGHNYKVTIELQNSDFDHDNIDMVMDFYDVKQMVNQVIDDKFDHKIILQELDEVLVGAFYGHNNVYFMKGRPTSENIAFEILKIINNGLPKHMACIAVTLEESPGKKVRVEL